MKKLSITKSTLLISTLFLASLLNAAKAEKTFTKSFDSSEFKNIAVSNINGSINCKGWDKKEILVEYTIKAQSKTEVAAQELIEEVDVKFTENENSLKIKAKIPKSSKNNLISWVFRKNKHVTVNYKIHVPENIAADFDSVNGGITLDNISGSVQAETVNGGINGKNLSALSKFETVNGGINCQIIDPELKNEVTLSTVNGGIKLSAPESMSCYLTASTVNGGISCSLPMSEVITKKRRALKAKINNGGPRVKIDTVNGGVSVKKI